MAQKGVQLDRDIISCSICLDFLKDPVTVPCGHSYCMGCIKTHWDGEFEKPFYSCPQCRKTFEQRPVLLKSTMLANLVEQLKKTGLQAAPADLCYAGPEDVACDYCTGRKLKAFKSCLVCLVSYCEKHLQPHYDVAPLKKHKLVEPSKKLQENICSQHDEVMKIFCRTDQKCICYVCSVEEHKGHDTVTAAAERAEKQRGLESSRQNIQQRIQVRKEDIKLLEREVEDIKCSADEAVKDSEETFNEIIRLIQKRSSEVKQKIISQQETEVSRVKEFQEKLEKEIAELRKKDTKLEQLSHTEDHNEFLRNYPSLSTLNGSTHSSSLNVRPLKYFDDVTEALSEFSDVLQDVLSETLTDISSAVTKVEVLLAPQPEPATRDDFLEYACEITLDPNTAHYNVLLSDGNRRAAIDYAPSCPSHPDRFIDDRQVLSEQSLTGRCYWEVELGRSGEGIFVAVANSRDLASKQCRFGYDDKSWALDCNGDDYTFWYNKDKTPISGPDSSRVGVYLDHGAGVLSFYSVSEANNTMTLLHTVQTEFTEPLYAGFGFKFWFGAKAELINLKRQEEKAVKSPTLPEVIEGVSRSTGLKYRLSYDWS